MRRMLSVASLLLLVLMLLQSGCASREDVQILDSQLRRNQQDTDQIKAELEQTRAELQKAISSATTPFQATQANIWSDLEQARNRQSAMEGRLEAIENTLSVLQQQNGANAPVLKRLQFEVETMRQALAHELGLDLPEFSSQNATAKAAAPSPAAAVNATAAVPAAVLVAPQQPEIETDPAKALYDAAMEAFKARDYDKARRLWSEFGKAYPKNSLAPNSWFWQGECYYQQGNYAQAVLSYQHVLDHYPKSSKFKTALLKQGVTWYKLKKDQAGRLRLEELIKRFPDSAEAKRAKGFLDKQ
ncbi:MAG: tol-pal system protein YbgF [Desulfovibrionaceae bacterium]